MACNHDKFSGGVTVVHTDKGRYRVDVKITCVECDVPFRFEKPFISATDGLELSAEVLPGALEANRPLSKAAINELARLT